MSEQANSQTKSFGSFYAQSPGSAEIAARFPDLHPAFDKTAAVTEANR